MVPVTNWSFYFSSAPSQEVCYKLGPHPFSPLAVSFHSIGSRVEVTDPSGIEICVGWERSFQFHFSTHLDPVFPASLIEDAIFALIYILGIFIKNHESRPLGLSGRRRITCLLDVEEKAHACPAPRGCYMVSQYVVWCGRDRGRMAHVLCRGRS